MADNVWQKSDTSCYFVLIFVILLSGCTMTPSTRTHQPFTVPPPELPVMSKVSGGIFQSVANMPGDATHRYLKTVAHVALAIRLSLHSMKKPMREKALAAMLTVPAALIFPYRQPSSGCH